MSAIFGRRIGILKQVFLRVHHGHEVVGLGVSAQQVFLQGLEHDVCGPNREVGEPALVAERCQSCSVSARTSRSGPHIVRCSASYWPAARIPGSRLAAMAQWNPEHRRAPSARWCPRRAWASCQATTTWCMAPPSAEPPPTTPLLPCLASPLGEVGTKNT